MCEHGSTTDIQVWIPAELSHTGTGRWDTKPIDACIAPIVHALSVAGIKTVTSCCGHGTGDGEIMLEDGRRLVVVDKGAGSEG